MNKPQGIGAKVLWPKSRQFFINKQTKQSKQRLEIFNSGYFSVHKKRNKSNKASTNSAFLTTIWSLSNNDGLRTWLSATKFWRIRFNVRVTAGPEICDVISAKRYSVSPRIQPFLLAPRHLRRLERPKQPRGTRRNCCIHRPLSCLRLGSSPQTIVFPWSI